MTLPAPRYTTTGLDAWTGAVPAPLPLPPGDRSTWTCLLALLGPGVLFINDDRGLTEGVDHDLMRLILKELGRPVRTDERAAMLLATPIPGGSTVTDVMARLLRNDSYWVRQRVALCLGHMGDDSCVDALLVNVNDDDNDARRGACEALGRLGAVRAALPLVKRIGDSDSSVDGACIEAIIRLNCWDEVAEAIAALDGDEHESAKLLQEMLEAEKSGEAGELPERLSGGEDWMRRATGRYLARRPELAAQCVEALVAHLETEDDMDVAMVGAEAAGAAGEEATEALVELLDHTNWKVRMTACMAFAAMEGLGPAAAAVVAKLGDDDTDVQREAALALVVHGEARAQAASKLNNSFTTSYQFVRRAAEAAAKGAPELKMIGMLTGTAAPGRELLSLLTASYGDDKARGTGAMLLALAEPDLVAPALEALCVDTAQSHGVDFRRYCAGGLLLTGRAPARMGALHRILLCHEGSVSSMPKGSVAGLASHVGELAALAASDSDWQVRLDALKLLQLLGESAAPFADLIAHVAAADSDSDCRNQAADMVPSTWALPDLSDRVATLVAPGPHASSEARANTFREVAAEDAALGQALASQFMGGNDRSLARAAAKVLGAAATEATVQEIVGIGVGRLEDSGWIARESACDLLGAISVELMGELAEEVAEALNARAEEDDDSDVQNAARAALALMGVEGAGEDE